MFEWSQQDTMIRMMMREFCEKNIAPQLDELEEGSALPYPIIRKFFEDFGISMMLSEQIQKRIDKAKKAEEEGTPVPSRRTPSLEEASMRVLPVIELSRYSPGLITAMGVSVGLTVGSIMSRGSIRQKEAFVPPLVTLEKVGAWAITEPGSGSDAFGAMRATARQDGDGFVLNGQKTFITNGPFADTIIFICKLDQEGVPPERRPVVSFILDGDTPGLTRSKPLRKMGMHSSPTGELFLEDVRVGKDRLMGEDLDVALKARDEAKKTFTTERTGVPAMALGMIERCLELSVEYSKTRVQFGKPIADRQLIQLKLAKMEVARQNVQGLLFRLLEMEAAGKHPTLAEASAAKLYSAQVCTEVCMEAVQLHGGNGYMSEYRVEQLARDSKVLQIYGGTDEIQVCQIARDLLSR